MAQHTPSQHESLKDDDGTDQLELLIKELQAKAEGEEPKEKSILDSDSEEEEPKRKSKYQSPEYIFIFDDLSTELKSSTIPRLLKVNRHFLCKTLISSQWWNDLHPMSRKQADYFICFEATRKRNWKKSIAMQICRSLWRSSGRYTVLQLKSRFLFFTWTVHRESSDAISLT